MKDTSKRYCRLYSAESIRSQLQVSDSDDSDECPTPVSETFAKSPSYKPKTHTPEPAILTKGFNARKEESAADFDRVLLFGFYNDQGKKKVCSTIKVSLSPPIISN